MTTDATSAMKPKTAAVWYTVLHHSGARFHWYTGQPQLKPSQL